MQRIAAGLGRIAARHLTMRESLARNDQMPVGGFSTEGSPVSAAHLDTTTYIVRSDGSDSTQRVRNIGAHLAPPASRKPCHQWLGMLQACPLKPIFSMATQR